MFSSVATVPLGPFVRFVIFTATGIYSNWDTISGLFDRHVENATAPIYGYYCQHVFEGKDVSATFSTRERGLFGMHYVNSTGGDLDTTWTTADYTAVEAAVQAFWTANASNISADWRLVEHRWYPFGPAVVPPNPPVRVTTLGTPIVGSGGNGVAHQLASTVTFRTALRRHWGRIYIPFSGMQGFFGGQGPDATVDALANSARTMITGPATSQGVMPVIWDRNRKVALGITAIEADGIPDIVRRRRPRTPHYKKILTS